jgi:hypothetical protein
MDVAKLEGVKTVEDYDFSEVTKTSQVNSVEHGTTKEQSLKNTMRQLLEPVTVYCQHLTPTRKECSQWM